MLVNVEKERILVCCLGELAGETAALLINRDYFEGCAV